MSCNSKSANGKPTRRPAPYRLAVECLEDRCTPSQLGPWDTPVNLGSVVNSASSDQHPAISKDGLSLYITTNRPENSDDLVLDDNIWVSQRASVNDPWGAPVELGAAVNTAANDRVPTFSRDGHWMYFGSNRAGGSGGIDVWASYRQDVHDDFAWQPAVNLGPGVNSASDDDGPTFFQDEEAGTVVLYFTSFNRSGNVGDWDIYVSTQNPDGSFGPAALVPELSSPQRDTRTAIRHDGLEIFITTNRVGSMINPATGLRSLDVWVSTRASTSDPWGTPINLGPTVNTATNDGAPAISSDSLTLYFYSDRPGGNGGNDLYMTTRMKIPGRDEAADMGVAVQALVRVPQNLGVLRDSDSPRQGSPEVNHAAATHVASANREPLSNGLDLPLTAESAAAKQVLDRVFADLDDSGLLAELETGLHVFLIK